MNELLNLLLINAISDLAKKYTTPKPAITHERADYEKLDKWAQVELSYFAKHFTKATEMLVKAHSVLLCDVLTIGEVNLLHAFEKYSHLADDGEMVGEPVKAMMLANEDVVKSIEEKLRPYEQKKAVVWVFLEELENLQATIKGGGVCRM